MQKDQSKRKLPKKHWALDKSSIYDFISDDELVMDKSGLLKAGRKILKQVEDESARRMEHFLPAL